MLRLPRDARIAPLSHEPSFAVGEQRHKFFPMRTENVLTNVPEEMGLVHGDSHSETLGHPPGIRYSEIT